ncbi:MAG: hypothetical protein GW892_19920 [Armatimonadetes bacterium]|nr:hypothetical protein [Armatimonadota bacterium]NCO92687.1 hypothetical protein [Armatimonadota bacterium]NCP28871.1 hypothetical protein [Armatimonadota bacterium]NCQ32270.1 hypothetical protein [Armatimonadota bacterium]PIU93671.1 MAG: hypothetical protein COS65_11405 [Armatimonadetes bacterium CG06_land_8_20_14_3_00_66_21]
MADTTMDQPACDELGRGVSVLATGLLDQDALWEVVAAEHPELDAESEGEEPPAQDFDSADPFVHLQCPVLVENQLFHDEPPQVRKALRALREKPAIENRRAALLARSCPAILPHFFD